MPVVFWDRAHLTFTRADVGRKWLKIRLTDDGCRRVLQLTQGLASIVRRWDFSLNDSKWFEVI